MEQFFLNPYTAAHVGMLIEPLLTVSVAASLGTQAAAGVPKFDAGWSATEAPVTETDTLGLMVIHYLVHNLLWLLHLWRALHPEQHTLVVPYATLWSLLGIGFLTNILCVLPASAHDILGLTYEIDWLITPVVTYASSFLLPRVCWSWLVCAQIAAVGADWRAKALIAAWLVVDVTTLLVLRVATLPSLVISLLAVAWAYRRFGWRRTTAGAATQYSDVDADAPPPVAAPRRAAKKPSVTTSSSSKPEPENDGSSSSDDDGGGGRVTVFEIGDTKDDIEERRQRRLKTNARRGSHISI
jgi:hypothetical protein